MSAEPSAVLEEGTYEECGACTGGGTMELISIEIRSTDEIVEHPRGTTICPFCNGAGYVLHACEGE